MCSSTNGAPSDDHQGYCLYRAYRALYTGILTGYTDHGETIPQLWASRLKQYYGLTISPTPNIIQPLPAASLAENFLDIVFVLGRSGAIAYYLSLYIVIAGGGGRVDWVAQRAEIQRNALRIFSFNRPLTEKLGSTDIMDIDEFLDFYWSPPSAPESSFRLSYMQNFLRIIIPKSPIIPSISNGGVRMSPADALRQFYDTELRTDPANWSPEYDHMRAVVRNDLCRVPHPNLPHDSPMLALASMAALVPGTESDDRQAKTAWTEFVFSASENRNRQDCIDTVNNPLSWFIIRLHFIIYLMTSLDYSQQNSNYMVALFGNFFHLFITDLPTAVLVYISVAFGIARDTPDELSISSFMRFAQPYIFSNSPLNQSLDPMMSPLASFHLGMGSQVQHNHELMRGMISTVVGCGIQCSLALSIAYRDLAFAHGNPNRPSDFLRTLNNFERVLSLGRSIFLARIFELELVSLYRTGLIPQDAEPLRMETKFQSLLSLRVINGGSVKLGPLSLSSTPSFIRIRNAGNDCMVSFSFDALTDSIGRMKSESVFLKILLAKTSSDRHSSLCGASPAARRQFRRFGASNPVGFSSASHCDNGIVEFFTCSYRIADKVYLMNKRVTGMCDTNAAARPDPVVVCPDLLHAFSLVFQAAEEANFSRKSVERKDKKFSAKQTQEFVFIPSIDQLIDILPSGNHVRVAFKKSMDILEVPGIASRVRTNRAWESIAKRAFGDIRYIAGYCDADSATHLGDNQYIRGKYQLEKIISYMEISSSFGNRYFCRFSSAATGKSFTIRRYIESTDRDSGDFETECFIGAGLYDRLVEVVDDEIFEPKRYTNSIGSDDRIADFIPIGSSGLIEQYITGGGGLRIRNRACVLSMYLKSPGAVVYPWGEHMAGTLGSDACMDGSESDLINESEFTTRLSMEFVSVPEFSCDRVETGRKRLRCMFGLTNDPGAILVVEKSWPISDSEGMWTNEYLWCDVAARSVDDHNRRKAQECMRMANAFRNAVAVAPSAPPIQ